MPPVDVARDAGSSAPVFLSFGTDVTSLTEGGTVTFTAVLTDPDGLMDLVGGTLLDAAGVARYGAFMASGGTGSYAKIPATVTVDSISCSLYYTDCCCSF